MSHVPTMLKSDRLVFEKMLLGLDNGKNPSNIFYSGTKRSMALDFERSIGDVGPTRFAQMMHLG